MSKIRANIFKNGEPAANHKAIVIEKSWDELFKAAKNKLRMKKPSRIFNFLTSTEVFATDVESLVNDCYLVFSEGADLIKAEAPSKKVIAKHTKNENVLIHILAKESWLEDEAIQQLNNVAKSLKGVVLAAGMPDLHAGKGFPVGSSIGTDKMIYPSLIGSDIGCGMTLYELDTTKDKLKLDKWTKALYGLETAFEGDCTPWLKSFNVNATAFDANSLGTIGGGNHFAELQQIHKVIDEAAFNSLKMDENALFLLVHSGSRGYGFQVLTEHETKFGTGVGFEENTKEANEYLAKHNNACNWAKANRAIIAQKFMDCINVQGTCRFDIWHNNVVKKTFSTGQELWLHRKGAAPADQGPIIIPGSRGSFSYLVVPTDNVEKLEYAGYSVAHGAGRKMTRSKALEKKSKISQSELLVTELGSRVICEDTDLLYEEAPTAYKDIDQVVADLVNAGVVTVACVLAPLISYKTRAKQHDK